MEMLRDHVAWLDGKIKTDEEANDPDGRLAGLYWARKEAVDALRKAAEPSEGVNVAVWSSSDPLAALSGSYMGREAMAEGFAAVLMTVMDLWNAGEPGIQIELYRTDVSED